MKYLIVAVLLLFAAVADAQTLSYPGSGNGIPNLPCAAGEIPIRTAGATWICGTNTSGGAPTASTYITEIADGTLSNEFALGSLAAGLIVNTTGTGIPTIYAGSTPCANSFVRTISATGATTCVAVNLAADVSGILPPANGGTGLNATPSDDSVFIGNGSIFQSSIIPDCNNTVTSKLIYSASSNTFQCSLDQTGGTSGTGNVVGPASSQTNALAFFSGATGKLLTDASVFGLAGGQFYGAAFDQTGGTVIRPLSGFGDFATTLSTTLVNPFILGFDNANHDHSGLSQGGQFNPNNAFNATLAVNKGGTGTTTSSGSGSVLLSTSPVMSGAPSAPTAAANDSSTLIATTAFVQGEVHESGGIGSSEITNIFGSPQSCTNCAISTDVDGRVTAIATGSGGSGSGIQQIGDCISSPCYQTEAQNKVLAAPTGSTGQVTSRLLVDADIPSGITGSKIGSGISATNVTTGTLSVNRFNNGTNADAAHFLSGAGTWLTPSGTGTVTSVDLSVPASSIFASSGGPVTVSGTLALATNGTSGGMPYFSSATQLSSSAALTASRLIVGGGAGAAPTVVGSLGTTTTLLHGNAGGAPSFGAVNLAAGGDITGALTVVNGGTGATTFTNGGILMGAAGGAVTATAVLTNGQLLIGDGTTNPTVGTLSGTAAEVDITNGVGTIAIGLPNDVTITNNLSVNNQLLVANQADGSNGLDMFNNTAAMSAGSSAHCNLAFVNSRISKRCNGVATLTPYANIVAEGTIVLNTTIVNTVACSTVQTVAATGTLTTDTIVWTSNAAPVAPGALLTINTYPTADTANFLVCNPTAGNITPGARTLNWKVLR